MCERCENLKRIAAEQMEEGVSSVGTPAFRSMQDLSAMFTALELDGELGMLAVLKELTAAERDATLLAAVLNLANLARLTESITGAPAGTIKRQFAARILEMEAIANERR